MKVLHIMKTNTGAIWAFRQINNLVDHGIEVEVILPEENTGFALEYKKIGVKVHPFDASLPVRKPWIILKKASSFQKLVKSIKPDLIQCHFVTNILFCRIALRKMHIPRIFQVPGPLHLEHIFYRNMEIKSANKDDYWVGACSKTCDIYRKYGVPKDRIFLAYYTADFNEYARTTVRMGKFREEYGITNNNILVGTVSIFYKPKRYLLQFKGLKGHEDFIDAMSIVIQKNSNIKGVIIGGTIGNSEKYRQRMQKRALKKCGNNIIFAGHRSDILEIYPDLDIAVHPSRSENFGGSMESLSKGVPTITTDVGGFPELIKEGVTGYMVKAGKPKELADKILYVAEHYGEAKEIALNGQRFITGINNELSLKQITGIYETILKSSGDSK